MYRIAARPSRRFSLFPPFAAAWLMGHGTPWLGWVRRGGQRAKALVTLGNSAVCDGCAGAPGLARGLLLNHSTPGCLGAVMLMHADFHDENGVFTTHNSQYYLRAGRCVGVWSCRDGAWRPRHVALGQRLVGVFPLLPASGSGSGSVEPATLIGRQLLFENDVLSSPVLEAERTGDPPLRRAG